MAMTFQHGALIRFVLLYAGLFSAFGLVSPFLPAFLASRGLPPEDLGLVPVSYTHLTLPTKA